MSLFNDGKDQTPVLPQDQDPLEVLTGPGAKFDRSKYQSDQDMYRAIAKGKVEGDMYVDHLKQRFDEYRLDTAALREQYNAGPKVSELINQLTQRQPPAEVNHVVPQAQPEEDANKLRDLFRAEILASKQADREQENLSSVERRLSEHYGPNYSSALKQQVENLGLTPDFINDLAKRSPQALFKTLGLDGQRQDTNFQAPLQSSQRQDPFSPMANKRTWAYYQKMRKDNPQVYRDPKTHNQMMKDALELGEAFEDGDYHTGFKHLSK